MISNGDTTSSATRVALIGLGYWGPNYARVLADLAEADLAWTCDLDRDALELVRRRYPSVALTTEIDDVLADPSVDAVLICTPTATHQTLSRAALEAGKHVLCEKPLALTALGCDDLVLTAAAADCVLMVGHTFIFNPAVRRMRTLIERGDLGQILYLHSTRTGLGPIRWDVNALWDLAPHDVSIMLYLVGRAPLTVSAQGASFLQEGTEDVVFMNLRFEGGVLANTHVSWLDPYKVRELTVVADQRMMVFDDVAPGEKLRLFDMGASYDSQAIEARGKEYGEDKAIVREGDIVIPRIQPSEPLREQVVHFLSCCRGELTPETDGKAARDVVSVLEAASESLLRGGIPVAVGTSGTPRDREDPPHGPGRPRGPGRFSVTRPAASPESTGGREPEPAVINILGAVTTEGEA